MSGIEGPGGPKLAPAVGETQNVASAEATPQAAATEFAAEVTRAEQAGSASSVTALAQQLEAGQLAPADAIQQLVSEAAAEVSPEAQAEFQELMRDLIATDPHLAELMAKLR